MSPREFKSVFIASDGWPKIKTEDAYFQTYIQTVFLSICFSFSIFFLFIKNLTTSLITFACIIFVIICTIFAVKVFGWEIGTQELVAITLLLAFSTEFNVIMGVNYIESKLEYRNEKMTQTYKYIGITIFYAWITILGVGLLQKTAILPMGFKYFYIVSATPTVSMIASLFLFGSISYMFGFEKVEGKHWCFIVNIMRERAKVAPAVEGEGEEDVEQVEKDPKEKAEKSFAGHEGSKFDEKSFVKSQDKSFQSRQDKAYQRSIERINEASLFRKNKDDSIYFDQPVNDESW